jgi:hypothetical protein
LGFYYIYRKRRAKDAKCKARVLMTNSLESPDEEVKLAVIELQVTATRYEF